MTTRHAEGASLTWIAFGCAGAASVLAASALWRTPCGTAERDDAKLAELELKLQMLQREVRALKAQMPTRIDPAQPSCVIMDHGPYVALSERYHVEDERSVTGVSGITEEVEFTDKTSTIERELGAGFGIRYHAFNVPDGAEVTWRVVYPHAIRGFADWRHDEDVAPGAHVRHVLYDFDYDYEMVAGAWKFEILIDGQARCSHTFDVK